MSDYLFFIFISAKIIVNFITKSMSNTKNIIKKANTENLQEFSKIAKVKTLPDVKNYQKSKDEVISLLKKSKKSK